MASKVAGLMVMGAAVPARGFVVSPSLAVTTAPKTLRGASAPERSEPAL
eukprot:CAMPEP_0195083848 /NCGR_PEP_ID=MMETSP0448-20130528/24680_1 /TAXON_ID=66468 /ORGANISM="Heterocapsa triquestra, Strain CCMP 448" /LENGTH=48 /DNA_ID= /DNA_START= /DNA_END= /DNA_ORIENTATION=